MAFFYYNLLWVFIRAGVMGRLFDCVFVLFLLWLLCFILETYGLLLLLFLLTDDDDNYLSSLLIFFTTSTFLPFDFYPNKLFYSTFTRDV